MKWLNAWAGPLAVAIISSVGLLALGAPALAVRKSIALPPPEIVGLSGDEAFLRIDLPVGSLQSGQADVSIEQALLLLRMEWPAAAGCLAILAFDPQTMTIPEGPWLPEGEWVLYSEQTCPVVHGESEGRYCVSLRPLAGAIRGEECSATALIIGMPAEDGGCTRLPADLIASIDASPGSWTARLDIHDSAIEEWGEE